MLKSPRGGLCAQNGGKRWALSPQTCAGPAPRFVIDGRQAVVPSEARPRPATRAASMANGASCNSQGASITVRVLDARGVVYVSDVVRRFSFCFPARRQKVAQISNSDASRKLGQDVCEVLYGIHIGETATSENGQRNRGAFAASIGTGVQKVLSCNCRSDVQALDDPVVYRHGAAFQESSQGKLMVDGIPKCSSRGR